MCVTLEHWSKWIHSQQVSLKNIYHPCNKGMSIYPSIAEAYRWVSSSLGQWLSCTVVPSYRVQGIKPWVLEQHIINRAGKKYRFINALRFICSRFNFDSESILSHCNLEVNLSKCTCLFTFVHVMIITLMLQV